MLRTIGRYALQFSLDTFFLLLLIGWSIFLIFHYTQGTFLDIGYQDWMAHAYRVKLLEQEGFISWTHMWANGISIWKAYQFIPHVITIAIMRLFDLPPTKAMLLVTVAGFISLRVVLYVTLRLVKTSPLIAFVCTLISFTIGQFWGGVADYSLLFGFILFPVYLYIWMQSYKGKIPYLFPYLMGLTFYIHPILGYSMFGLFIIGIILSSQKIVSIKTLLQGLIFLCTSSLFWFPVIVKTSFLYTNPFLTDRFFLSQVLRGYEYSGFSLSIFIIVPLVIVGVFAFHKKDYEWVKPVCLFAFLYLVAIFIGINYQLPKAFSQLQFTRGVTIVGICFMYLFAFVLQRLYIHKPKVGILLSLVLIIPIGIEGYNVTKTAAPPVVNVIPDPVSAFTNRSISDGKIWTSWIGPSSYFSPTSYQFPYSYMGHLDPNIISPRISQLIIYEYYDGSVPQSNMVRAQEYFKISGVKYIFLEEGNPYTNSLTDKNSALRYTDLGIVRSYNNLYRVFQVSYQPISGVALSPNNAKRVFTYPKELDISDIEDQVEIDVLTSKFNEIIYDKQNQRITVSYPTQDSLSVTIPKNTISNTIYVNESYDKEWRAQMNGKELTIQPTGPNYMLIQIDDTLRKNGGTIQLHHTFPLYQTLGSYLIILLGAEIVFITIANPWSKK